MPTANWGLSAGTISDFDRDKQFTPYQGPVPGNGVYKWKVANAWFAAATGDKLPQLRLLLVLDPRDKSEKRFTGYSQMAFLSVADNMAFRYVPFLDAIGVSDAAFRTRTKFDNDGRIISIGKWKNNGTTFVAAQLEDNDYEGAKNPKQVGWIGALADEPEPDEEDEYEEEEEYEYDEEEEDDGDEYEEEEEEEEPEPTPKRTRKARR